MSDINELLKINVDFLNKFPVQGSHLVDHQHELEFRRNIRRLKDIEDRHSLGNSAPHFNLDIDEVIAKVRRAATGDKEKFSSKELRMLTYYLEKLDDQKLFRYALDELLDNDENWRYSFIKGLAFFVLRFWNEMAPAAIYWNMGYAPWKKIAEERRNAVCSLIREKLESYEGTRYKKLQEHADYFDQAGPLRLARLLSQKGIALTDAPKNLGYKHSAITQSFYSDVIRYYVRDHKELTLQEVSEILPFDKAQAQLAQNQLKPKRIYKHVFLGRGIIKDDNGYILCGKKREKGGNYYAHSTHSNSGLTIAAAPIDKALWIIAKAQYKNKVELEKALGQDEMKERLLEVQGKLEAAKVAVAEYQTKLDRIEERYILGKLSAVKADELEADLNKQMMREQKNITKYEDQIRQLGMPLEESVKYRDNIDGITDPELQHQIIVEVIDYVTLIKERKNHYRMEVNYKPLFSGAGFTQIFQISTQLCHQSLKTGNLQFEL